MWGKCIHEYGGNIIAYQYLNIYNRARLYGN